MGYIYIIKNTVKNKVYIGQTSQSLKTRFNEHINCSRAINLETLDFMYKYKLYNAFRKYGVDKFYIELIEECDNELLNEKEKYYINYFNSFKGGYNSTLGGEGKRIYSFTEDEEQKIISNYKKLKSIKKNCRASRMLN